VPVGVPRPTQKLAGRATAVVRAIYHGTDATGMETEHTKHLGKSLLELLIKELS
jgi:hypothetical protein